MEMKYLIVGILLLGLSLVANSWKLPNKGEDASQYGALGGLINNAIRENTFKYIEKSDEEAAEYAEYVEAAEYAQAAEYDDIDDAVQHQINDLLEAVFDANQAQETRINDGIETWKNSSGSMQPGVNKGECHVKGGSATCCVKVHILKHDIPICLSVTYSLKDISLGVKLTVDGHTLVSKSISANSPPPLCVKFKKLGKTISICLSFYDLGISAHTFKGCAKATLKLAPIISKKITLGCFSIPVPHIADQTVFEGLYL